ncbi:MAG: hypothetical protein JST04_06530 [Bdellovibrionales bacterium]|nr:hypothetical protein [Bdellovibrionales bacterium]
MSQPSVPLNSVPAAGVALQERRRSVYRRYLEFVQTAHQKDRLDVNRRMRSVFVWCFLAPVVAVALVILMVNFGVLPRVFRSYQDWILLVFPVLYSLYFLGSQVLSSVPDAFRKGGFGMTLGQAAREADWRIEVCSAMERELAFNGDDWQWVMANAEEDLERMQMRNRHLTALAGAVFFLIMNGIDSLTNDSSFTVVAADPTSTTSSEWIGLALFLLLLYLSGQQSVQTLRRFLSCARLVQRQLPKA